MRRTSSLERVRLFGRAGIDVVAALGRSTIFPVSYTHLTLPTTPYV